MTFTTSDAVAPAHTLTVFPLGSSITEGDSAQSPYDGGGYRSQLYQNLANDGRFTPLFVGSNTGTGANNPVGPDLATTVGQGHNEGHSGYTTNQILANLASSYLAPGNGVNPDVVTLNVGGNDYVANPADTTAITRLGQIIDTVQSLRPSATVIVSTVLYRGDGGGAAGNGIVNLYDPLIPALVYQRVLAGEHVSFVDMNNLITPNKSLALIGPDLIHPTQAGYDVMANAWYTSVTAGQAFFTGNAGSAWNATAGGNTSFARDFQRTTDSGILPAAGTDVYFNGVGGATTLGADFSVRSVNFTAGATTPVSIGGGNTLTIGGGGITVQAGTAAHTISTAVNVGTAQSWSNVSTSRFTVSGTVTGIGPLTVGGTGAIVITGNNTYTGGTTIAGGTLYASNTAGSATGTAAVTVSAGSTLAGTGFVTGPVFVSGNLTLGNADGSFGTLTTGPETWNALGGLVDTVTANGLGYDNLSMTSLLVAASLNSKFGITVTSPAATTPASTLILATDLDPSSTNPFSPAIFASTTQAELNFTTSGLQPASGFAFQFGTQPYYTPQQTLAGYSLVLSQVAIPEPSNLLVVAAIGCVTLARRRRFPDTHSGRHYRLTRLAAIPLSRSVDSVR